MKERIRFVQSELIARGYMEGTATGEIDAATRKAMKNIIGLRDGWSSRKRIIGIIQLLALENKLEINPYDGIWGSQTEYAFDMLSEMANTGEMPDPNWRDTLDPEEPARGVTANLWPMEKESELIRYYGQVGENQTRIKVPYPHYLAWDNTKQAKTIKCHEKVADSLERVLKRVLDHYGPAKIKKLRLDQYGGCLNVRKIRGGNRWSTHAWGIALDYDPSNNKLRWKSDKATFAKPAYKKWWQLWEEEGWVSLGRTKNYDWMHVQAARR